jgi:hypothetical protein
VRDPPKAAAAAAPTDVSTASCGHPLQDFVGLGISGTDDNAALYTQALRAVDGSCDTCASARAPSGNFFTLVLPVRRASCVWRASLLWHHARILCCCLVLLVLLLRTVAPYLTGMKQAGV